MYQERKARTSSRIHVGSKFKPIIANSENPLYKVKNAVSILFWQINKRINDEILYNKRVEYEAQIIKNLSEMLPAKEKIFYVKYTIEEGLEKS